MIDLTAQIATIRQFIDSTLEGSYARKAASGAALDAIEVSIKTLQQENERMRHVIDYSLDAENYAEELISTKQRVRELGREYTRLAQEIEEHYAPGWMDDRIKMLAAETENTTLRARVEEIAQTAKNRLAELNVQRARVEHLEGALREIVDAKSLMAPRIYERAAAVLAEGGDK
jgi:DNA repair exonuclease SbcCD ATPase subunit